MSKTPSKLVNEEVEFLRSPAVIHALAAGVKVQSSRNRRSPRYHSGIDSVAIRGRAWAGRLRCGDGREAPAESCAVTCHFTGRLPV